MSWGPDRTYRKYLRYILNTVFFPTFSILVVMLSFSLIAKDSYAAYTLIGTSDFINDDRPSATDVIHNISFVIPREGAGLGVNDFIIIDLPNYADLTLPTSSSGWSSGTPLYTIDETRVLITNVTASPGMAIGISGLRATNPPVGLPTQINISIANDSLPTIVLYESAVVPDTYKSTTTTSVIVTTQIGELEFRGFASPNSFVTILVDGAVAGTTTAGSDGTFIKYIGGLEPNIIFDITIYSTDISGKNSEPINFSAMTLTGVYVVVQNLVLPPTIAVEPNQLYQGDLTNISGYAFPYSQVSIYVEGSHNYNFMVIANGSGAWQQTLDTRANLLSPGTQTAYAKGVVPGGYVSPFTQHEEFNVTKCMIADLNCDQKVDLIDFSIMMYFWNSLNPTNRRADVNHDTVVNITDFSLLLYHWTG